MQTLESHRLGLLVYPDFIPTREPDVSLLQEDNLLLRKVTPVLIHVDKINYFYASESSNAIKL